MSRKESKQYKKQMNQNKSLIEKRKELFETELLGKTTSAGRIYRKILQQDKEAVENLNTLIWEFGFSSDKHENIEIKRELQEEVNKIFWKVKI